MMFFDSLTTHLIVVAGIQTQMLRLFLRLRRRSTRRMRIAPQRILPLPREAALSRVLQPRRKTLTRPRKRLKMYEQLF